MLEKVKNIIKIMITEWSLYLFLISIAIGFIPYYTLDPNNKLSFQELGVYFAMMPIIAIIIGCIFLFILLRLRNKVIDNRDASFGSLVFSFIKHVIKLLFTLIPLLIIYMILFSIIISFLFEEKEFSEFVGLYLVYIMPFVIFMNSFMIAGIAYILFTGKSRYSIRSSFKLLKHNFKSLAIFSLIQVVIPVVLFILFIYSGDIYETYPLSGFLFNLYNNFIYVIAIMYMIREIDVIDEGILPDYKMVIEPDFS